MQAYDIIGDIHGHGEALIQLLKKLGYQDHGNGYQHETRKVIFLGDFIDRGEELKQHRLLLNTVIPMVNAGHALAVMGNHEFNALAYHTKHDDGYLRPHTPKNTKQHQAFLNEYENDPEEKHKVLDFFYTLPLWLELDGLRIIHACWSQIDIDYLKKLMPNHKLTPELLIKVSIKDTPEYKAIETILKGVEVNLPDGITFKDKDDNERDAVRIAWWRQEAKQLGEVVLPSKLDIGDAATQAIPNDVPNYNQNQPPCFIGHYWMQYEPEPLTDNIACVDYSVAKPKGKLVAYRWQGEKQLKKKNFVSYKS